MVYEYECECGHREDVDHPMTEDPEVKCQGCGKTMYRVITGGCGYRMASDGTRNI